ncbi:hypothetical protein J4573_53325 [Actinomadura barringtoniae]|uniref:Lipoprotein n=1 Tax=Actinomadura barringtoniae TaxID=1427535 RepID=A0A939PW58_9ACTN|nr:hypothetical protein [Actinomadura barringtoniae]MBO2455941.1 hypothetical protein [Actinomadura barringtoniae]
MRMRIRLLTLTLAFPVLSGCGLVLDHMSGSKSNEGPPAPLPTPPPGWKAIVAGKYGYLVRPEWKIEPSGDVGVATVYDDPAGQWRMHVQQFTGCGDANKAEDLSSFSKQIDPKESLQTFTLRKQPQKMTVPGAAGGWRYETAGSGGHTYTTFNVWVASKRSHCWSELWMTLPGGGDAETMATNFTASPPP